MTAKTYKVTKSVFSLTSLFFLFLSICLLVERFFFIKPLKFEEESGIFHLYTTTLNNNLFLLYVSFGAGMFFFTFSHNYKISRK